MLLLIIYKQKSGQIFQFARSGFIIIKLFQATSPICHTCDGTTKKPRDVV